MFSIKGQISPCLWFLPITEWRSCVTHKRDNLKESLRWGQILWYSHVLWWLAFQNGYWQKNKMVPLNHTRFLHQNHSNFLANYATKIEKQSWLTLSGDSKSVNSNKSSTAQEDVKLGTCWEGTFTGTSCAFGLDGSTWPFSLSLVQLEPKATRIPVARKRWWFPERLPATWIGSSQSLQKSALSSTQNMKAALSYSYITYITKLIKLSMFNTGFNSYTVLQQRILYYQ